MPGYRAKQRRGLPLLLHQLEVEVRSSGVGAYLCRQLQYLVITTMIERDYGSEYRISIDYVSKRVFNHQRLIRSAARGHLQLRRDVYSHRVRRRAACSHHFIIAARHQTNRSGEGRCHTCSIYVSRLDLESHSQLVRGECPIGAWDERCSVV